MTGGYKIIDLYGLDLANMQLDSTKIEKIFNDIESTYKTKALLFDNYKINDVKQNATFSSATVKNSGFEISLGDYKVLIKNDSVEDTTPHLYRHDIFIDLADTNYLGEVRFTLYNTNNNTISNKEELLNNFTLLDIGAIGYIINTSDNTYPIIYHIYIDSEYNYIYYTDGEHNFTITNIEDTITKIF